MPSQLQAEFEKLWGTGSPPDVIQFLSSRKESSSEEFAAVTRLDQQHRWRTTSPLKVEQYLAAFPQLQANDDLVLELTAGEFLARLQNGQLPLIDEYIHRFPQLSEQLQIKLSGITSTHNPSGTSQRSVFVSNMGLMEIDDICEAFEDVWKEGKERPSIEDHLQAAPAQHRPAVLKELLRIELCFRNDQGEKATLEEYRSRFPANDPLFKAVLADWEQNPNEFLLHNRVSAAPMTATVLKPQAMNSSQSGSLTVDGSHKIDHFRLLKEVGHGAFGRVFQAYDEQLERAVAIKIPRRSRFQRPEDAEAYLAEARTVARLEHPQIVSVYQMGRTPDGSVYVVSQLIEGGTLADLIENNQPDQRHTATLIAQVARALHFAHQNRLIHRDIKPANILIEERTGKPFVADFGLAMKEEDYIKQVAVAGTPAYMSPEQARAEGHRLDGRSDVFSVGVILYEMLTGKRPFKGSTVYETLHQVTAVDPRPPRTIDETIPAELERICLRAISKKVSDRYATAELLAEDLEAWLQPTTKPVLAAKADVQVVPKGLRSFDANDADFFLDLLPGTRNRDGLPESIAFWKQRIEETDPERTFNVGLIYGPSGCGKSSLVKAGLLPHLSEDVIAVYLEATPDETELRILRGLRKRIESLATTDEPQGATVGWTFLSDSGSTGRNAHPTPNRSLTTSATGLVDTFLHLRRNHQHKIVIIIDQFEQWLHAHRSEPDAELVQALRQCDGVRVQAIVMIRDDFAMAAARFMQALDVSIVQGQNFATVDLFEIDHAKNVLIKFGQSFGKLPANSENLSPEEQHFVTDVANGLAQDGKVVSVRLSLFAEMVKIKRWTVETLQAVGGTEGIGVNFLEETFSSPQANPRHRLHATAARAVLKSLLPELGTDIKGHMRSQQELLESSGYIDRPTDFTDLLRILDGELRLVTPTDPEGESLSGSSRDSSLATRYYQLTHDYLVPSLREWLTRKQRETRRGRAELKLEERSAIWNAKQENKQLPTVTEWLSIRALSDSKRWTAPQSVMMRKAARVHGTLWGSVLLTLLLVGVGIQQWASAVSWASLQEQTRAAAESLQNNLGPTVPVNIKELKRLPETLVLSELQSRFVSATNASHKLSLAFALAGYGELDADYLVSEIDAIAESDARNYVTALQANPTRAVSALKAAAQKCSDKSLWRRKAKLAIVALALDDAELALDVCAFENRPDPEQRTLFIDEFRKWELEKPNGFSVTCLKTMLDAVKNSESPALRSGICLAVGQVAVEKFLDADKELWQSLASQWFVQNGDTTTHSAAGWLLRRWKFPLPEILKPHEISRERDWFVVKTTGATMLRIRPEPPAAAAVIPDPVEKYRQQLLEMQTVAAAELEKPEMRMERAIAHFQVGNLDLALKDLDVLMENESSGVFSPALLFRTLTLARMGKADETRESLAKYLEQEVPASYRSYMQIQVSAWLGDSAEALRQLETASNDASADSNMLYNLACAAALCAQATSVNDADESQRFANRAIELLKRAVSQGYQNANEVLQDPDFAVIHGDARFASILETMGGTERPAQISGEFWVGDREVTRGQFASFMNDANYATTEKPAEWEGVDTESSPSADHPAQQVSWYDAVMYCNWLSHREGLQPCYERTGVKEKGGYDETMYDAWRLVGGSTGYRLLQESEWEYACRAGTTTESSSGDDETMLIDYCQMYPSKLTALCGEKLPNAWGLHDVHGNVWEWCADLFRESGGSGRVLRGGGWSFDAALCRAAYRGTGAPSDRSFSSGFRLALSSPSAQSPEVDK